MSPTEIAHKWEKTNQLWQLISLQLHDAKLWFDTIYIRSTTKYYDSVLTWFISYINQYLFEFLNCFWFSKLREIDRILDSRFLDWDARIPTIKSSPKTNLIWFLFLTLFILFCFISFQPDMQNYKMIHPIYCKFDKQFKYCVHCSFPSLQPITNTNTKCISYFWSHKAKSNIHLYCSVPQADPI